MTNAACAADGQRTPGATTAHDEKLSEIGARVAQVVHELNVPLSLVIGSLQTLEQYAVASAHYIEATRGPAAGRDDLEHLRAELDLDYLVDNAPALIQICREGTRRLTHVIQQLRAYARQAADLSLPMSVDVRKVLQDAVSLAGCGRDTVPSVHYDLTDLAPVVGVAESLVQAFVNVVGNAFDAVATVADPSVWVCTHTELASKEQTGCPDDWLEVRVGDNGSGIRDLDRQRIFEPFFTTKSRRSGMGLGLAITREIVEGHGGTITLDASAPHRTEFVIRLPVEAAGRRALTEPPVSVR